MAPVPIQLANAWATGSIPGSSIRKGAAPSKPSMRRAAGLAVWMAPSAPTTSTPSSTSAMTISLIACCTSRSAPRRAASSSWPIRRAASRLTSQTTAKKAMPYIPPCIRAGSPPGVTACQSASSRMKMVAIAAENSASASGARIAAPASGNRYRMPRPLRTPPAARYSSEMTARSSATWAASWARKRRRHRVVSAPKQTAAER